LLADQALDIWKPLEVPDVAVQNGVLDELKLAAPPHPSGFDRIVVRGSGAAETGGVRAVA
jgi:hypothetical protein